MGEACELSAVEARRLIGAKKLSPVELLKSCLQRIEKTNARVNSIVAMDEKAALARARAIEQSIMRGEPQGLLAGLPIGVKDLQATAGLATTWGSLIYKGHVPQKDELTVGYLRQAGGIVLAKTNTPEFGAGANTVNRVYGATGNPFDPVKTCGGSSGGSAVALALSQVPLATGSDYGGSLRTPAGYSGVVGFRPTPGLVPNTDRAAGLSPFSVTGPMGRSVRDAHLLLKAQIGEDRRDPFSSSDYKRIPDALTGCDLSGLKVAFSADLGCAPVAKRIREVFAARVKKFGHVFRSIEERAPDFSGVHDGFEVLRGVAFTAAHRERLEQHRDLLDRNVIDNTERALKWSLGDVARAHIEQTKLMKRVLDFFEEVDVLICPAASVSPFPHRQLFVEEIDGERMPTYMRWLAIVYAPTMALSCVACLPCGRDHMGLPFGIQLVGPKGSDASLLNIAHAIEEVLSGDPDTARPVPAPMGA